MPEDDAAFSVLYSSAALRELRLISIVVPVYNSELLVPRLAARLEDALRGIKWELVLVNDGSRDGSWEVIRRLAFADERITGINLMRNFGQHNALLCGIRQAKGDVIVTIDDDLQNPPEAIPLLLDRIQAGADLVYGTPVRLQHALWRNASSVIVKWLLRAALGVHTASRVSAMRAFRANLRECFRDFSGEFVSIDVLLSWGTSRVESVPVEFAPRQGGVSNYTFHKLLIHTLNMVTGFSILPLRLASFLGLVMSALGFVVLVFVIGRYLLEGGRVPGFPFLASIVAIFSGTQMLALGIIGEYVARIHLKAMGKPSYAVKEVVRFRS